MDGKSNYYPSFNVPIEVGFYHEFAPDDPDGDWEELEWSEQIILRLTVEPVATEE